MCQGAQTGVISYDDRKRELRLNEDKAYALEAIDSIISRITYIQDKELSLKVSYPCSEVKSNRIKSSLLRELHYNIEHLVHHMAIIKIGVMQHYPHIGLANSFGVSESTLAYQNQ